MVVRRRGGEERGHHPQREHRGEQRGDERDGRGVSGHRHARTWYWDHATAVMTKSVSQGMTYTRLMCTTERVQCSALYSWKGRS